MLQLIKKFTTDNLLNDNYNVCGPSILLDDHIMIYRDGRPVNPLMPVIDESKVLKVCSIDEQYNTNNHRTISVKNEILSDSRLVKWNDKIYIDVTKIYHQPGTYTSKMDLYDYQQERLLNIVYMSAQPREKNWIFFQDPYSTDLLCSYSLWNNSHKVLKLNYNKLENYAITNYISQWHSDFGHIKNTSNFAHHNNLFWGCTHSHTYPTSSVYRMGIFAFEDKFPYKIIKMSNVPLFNITEPNQIFWGSYLDIKNDIFTIGISGFDFDHFNIITLEKRDIEHHLNNNVSLDYLS